jgi:hypothetical protein
VTQVLSPGAKQQFFDNNGRPLVGGKLFTYEAGTTTKLATYTDSGGMSTNTNPVILDYRGECNLWIPPNVPYKYVLAPSTDTDPPTNPIWSVDDVVSSQLITLYGGVDTGVADAYVLNYDAPFTSYVDGTVIYWVPSNTNTGASTLNVNGLGPISITNPLGGAIVSGQLIAGQFVAVAYQSGAFVLLSFNNVYLAGQFTGTLTGVSGTVTQQFTYVRSGGITAIYCNPGISGTSNADTMTITGVPAAAQPITPQSILCRLTDNGTVQLGVVGVGSGTLIFGLGASGAPTGFTPSGSKGLPGGWSILFAS